MSEPQFEPTLAINLVKPTPLPYSVRAPSPEHLTSTSPSHLTR